jgi:FkbM family methyltransferase
MGTKNSLSAYGDRLLGSLVPRRNGAAGVQPAAVPDALPADEFELTVVDAGKLWISRRDQVMRPYMARAGTWEPDEGRVLLSLTKPGCRFLDIGANIGYFSVLVNSAWPGIVVDAVEPDPDNVRVLRFNLWFNEVAGTVWPLALDDATRALQLSGNEQNLGDLHSAHVGDAVGVDAAKWIVPAVSGDHLFAGRAFDLVKIDTQGWEFEILLGLHTTLQRSSGVRIVAEFCPMFLRAGDHDPLEILARYRELGYSVRTIVHGNPIDLVDADTVSACTSAGPQGQVNLLLSR